MMILTKVLFLLYLLFFSTFKVISYHSFVDDI